MSAWDLLSTHQLPAGPENKDVISFKSRTAHQRWSCVYVFDFGIFTRVNTSDKYSRNAKNSTGILDIPGNSKEGCVNWVSLLPGLEAFWFIYLWVNNKRGREALDLNFFFIVFYYILIKSSFTGISCLSAQDQQDVHKREKFNQGLSFDLISQHLAVEDTRPPTVTDHMRANGKSWEGQTFDTWNISAIHRRFP